jgi:hypothetical protein
MLSLSNLRARLRGEDGFTMLLVVGVMAVVLIIVGVVLTDVQGDFEPSRKDEDRKIAYAAAEAGVADYQARLEANPSYWSQCVDSTNPALGNVGTKNYVSLPSSSAQYAIELLPNAGYTACSTSDPASLVNGAGEFRIRVTGRPRSGSTAVRQIVATFRPKGFLNYIYYTDYETLDPKLYSYVTDGQSTSSTSQGDFLTWAADNCGTTRWPARGSLNWRGRIGGGNTNDYGCTEIQFAPGDKVSGPFHTNDQIMVCETPSFGRSPSDAVEIAGGSPGWRNAGCSSATRPKVNALPGSSAPLNSAVGTWTMAAQRDFPPSNQTLHDDAGVNYRFMGPTRVVLNGASMTVTGKREDGTVLTDAVMAIPEGVVYVKDDASAGSCQGYNPLYPYWNGSAYTSNGSAGAVTGNPACGDLFISGTYSQNVTFASGNDIIVTGNTTRTSAAWMLGLIPDKFARIFHPVNRSGSACSDTSGEITNVQVDAAILALTHSFTVDGYECGDGLGTLTIRGAIAQKYRGPVGTSGDTGFTKDYQYDQRLALRSPPRFMNPVQPAWALANRTEQIPAS